MITMQTLNTLAHTLLGAIIAWAGVFLAARFKK